MEFSGRLASFPIGDILQWAANDRRTGALIVRRSGKEKRIFFRDGDVVACFSDDAAEYFGQHLLVNGLLTDQLLIRALTFCQRNGRRLGEALQELGILPRPVILEALHRHTEDQVCDVFLWRSGVFYFAIETPPEEQALAEPLSAQALAMEGSRWADEHERIRRVFVHDNIVLSRGKAKPPLDLPALDKRIFRAIDGHLTLEELYNEVRGSYFRFLQAAFRLAVAQILDVVSVGDHAETMSTELKIADLLIEQVAEEEQAVFLRYHLAIPFDAIEHFVPTWLHPPDAAERAKMPEGMRAFVGEIDGQKSLRMLLAAVGDERTHRLDWLILQLRKGSIALLPGPVDTLDAAVAGSAADDAAGAGGRWWKKLF